MLRHYLHRDGAVDGGRLFMAFTDGGMQKYLGGMSQFMLKGMTLESTNALAGTIPESVFMTYQMTFAIITPALIVGAFADRMKFSALVLFMILWLLLVYAPIAHIGCGAAGSSAALACSISPAAPWCISMPVLRASFARCFSASVMATAPRTWHRITSSTA